MKSMNTIDTALQLHLLTLPGAPSIAWEDVSFTPTTGQAYLQVHQLRNAPIDHAITLDVLEQRGILQVTVVHPAGGAGIAAHDIAHAVASLFPRGLRLAVDEKTLTIYKTPAIATAYPDGGWLRVPVSISWRVL